MGSLYYSSHSNTHTLNPSLSHVYNHYSSITSNPRDPRGEGLTHHGLPHPSIVPSPTSTSPVDYTGHYDMASSNSPHNSEHSNYQGQNHASGAGMAHSHSDEMDLDQVLHEPLTDLPQAHNTHEKQDSDDNSEQPPIWAEMKTKAGKDRKRLPLACIACRRKKIRCSGEKPGCKHCVRSRIPCVYKVTTRKAAPRTDYMAMLDKRLKRMEDRVIKIIPKDQAGNIPTGARAVLKPPQPNTSTPQAQNMGKRRTADEAFGAQIEAWAETPAMPNKVIPKGPLEKDESAEENKLLSEGLEFLPSKEIQEHLAEVYFDNVYGQSYPLLHKPSYMRKLSAGTIPPVLILAVCAVSARFSRHPQIPSEAAAFLRGECWAKPAREIALRRYDSPNITILIVYLLLGLHEFGTCQGGRSWMLGGMAQRMAYALQLHRDLDQESFGQTQGTKSEMSFTDREIRRRTMWSCFLMDRFNSSGTQRPMFANEQYLNLQLPVNEHFFQMEIPGQTEGLDGTMAGPTPSKQGTASDPKANMGVTAYIIRAVGLWGQLIQYMNLGGREKDQYPIWSPKSAYHELYERVLLFERSLPETLHYNNDNLQAHATEKIANQFIYFHITCKQLILFANRFAFPAMANVRLPKDMPAEFLKKARVAALESAAAISRLVEDAMNHKVNVPFAGYCTYLSSAVHIHGMFSKQPELEASSKVYLTQNVKYLTRMKKYWGMFHFLTESLKELYRQHADFVAKGSGSGRSKDNPKSVFQYGDWYDQYPRGVSNVDYEDPVADQKKEDGTDAVMGQKSDLQSVEDFFATMSPKSQAKQARKMQKRAADADNMTPPASHHSYEGLTGHRLDGMSGPMHTQAHGQVAMPHSPPPYGFPESYDRTQAAPPMLQTNISVPPQMQQFAPQQMPNGMSQLEQQIILNSYNGMDQSLGTQNMGENFWDVDFTGFGDNFWANEGSSSWFMPFNLALPDDPGPMTAGSASVYQDFGMQRVDSSQSDFDFGGNIGR